MRIFTKLGCISVLVGMMSVANVQAEPLLREENPSQTSFASFGESLPVEVDKMPVTDLLPLTEAQFLPVQQASLENPSDFALLAQEPDYPEEWHDPAHNDPIFWLLLLEQLEYRHLSGGDSFNWEVKGWIGGDYRRIWLKTEGEVGLEETEGEFEVQLLYSRLIDPYWELQVGVRYDREFEQGKDRFFGVVGVQGLAPYLIETDAALFISEAGDISARLSAEYQLRLSQRLILQPELEINLAAQTVEEFGIGSGLNDIGLGLRLRYEISRKFAPYVGVDWSRKFGDTAKFARQEGHSVDQWALVGGVRIFF